MFKNGTEIMAFEAMGRLERQMTRRWRTLYLCHRYMEALMCRFAVRNTDSHPFPFDNRQVAQLKDRERMQKPYLLEHLNLGALHHKIQNLVNRGQSTQKSLMEVHLSTLIKSSIIKASNSLVQKYHTRTIWLSVTIPKLIFRIIKHQ